MTTALGAADKSLPNSVLFSFNLSNLKTHMLRRDQMGIGIIDFDLLGCGLDVGWPGVTDPS